MNRGTQNDMVRFDEGQVSFCAVTPPGQSGLVAPDGTKSPHYADQLGLYEEFGCRDQAVCRDDVEAAAVSRNAFTVEEPQEAGAPALALALASAEASAAA